MIIYNFVKLSDFGHLFVFTIIYFRFVMDTSFTFLTSKEIQSFFDTCTMTYCTSSTFSFRIVSYITCKFYFITWLNIITVVVLPTSTDIFKNQHHEICLFTPAFSYDLYYMMLALEILSPWRHFTDTIAGINFISSVPNKFKLWWMLNCYITEL